MEYMLMICAEENSSDDPSIIQRFNAFTTEVRESGKLVTAFRLQPAESASTLRIRGGEPQVTDGPFAETKEQLGGFYILDCADLDEALAYAAKIPTAAYGSVEVRPIWQG